MILLIFMGILSKQFPASVLHEFVHTEFCLCLMQWKRKVLQFLVDSIMMPFEMSLSMYLYILWLLAFILRKSE